MKESSKRRARVNIAVQEILPIDEANASSASDVQVVQVVENKNYELQMDINASSVLIKGKKDWLDNFQLIFALKLIQTKFPNFNINYKTVLFDLDKIIRGNLFDSSHYCIIKPNSLFVLHLCKNHWALLSNVNCESYSWNLYDSLNNVSYVYALQTLFSCMSEIDKDVSYYIINHIVLPKQKGTSDCGLFSLAYSHSLCQGIDPSNVLYDQSQMRAHYNKCAIDGKFEPFPSQDNLKRSLRKPGKSSFIFSCKTLNFE